MVRFLVLVVLVTVIGCAKKPPVEYLDLAEHFDRAEITLSIDGRPRAEAGLLFLPVGSSTTFTVEARSASLLWVERRVIRGEGTRLEVLWGTESAPTSIPVELERVDGGFSARLPTPGLELGSLTLRASGVGTDGDGVLLSKPALLGGPAPELGSRPPEWVRVEQPDVIVYLVDTLRRDRLGVYGYHRPVSPSIDAFAADATVFDNSLGQSSWTKASVASMWTGVWPPEHGAVGWGSALDQSEEVLADRLAGVGYETAAFVTNINAGPAFGLAQGFEHLWFEKKALSHRVNEQVVDWLDARESPDKPLFLYVHTMDPHAGYNPGDPFRSRFAPNAGQMKPWKPRWRWPIGNLPFFSNLYDGEIAQNDDAFGEFLGALDERGLTDDALIILLSDHGEEFKEHGGWRHGRVLHAGSLDVPIIAKFPRQESGLRSPVRASHVDVMPTVLDVAGLASVSSAEGRSWVDPRERPVFSHLRLGSAPLQYAVSYAGWKLIYEHREEPRIKLFNRNEDPDETYDVANDNPYRMAHLQGLLQERLAQVGERKTTETELTQELTEELRALGYLQ